MLRGDYKSSVQLRFNICLSEKVILKILIALLPGSKQHTLTNSLLGQFVKVSKCRAVFLDNENESKNLTGY